MDRSPPYDLTAERATLGAVLMERDAILVVGHLLTAEQFYLEKHGLIWSAALACAARREPPDLATVAAELRRQGHLEIVGGIGFLSQLVADVPMAVHVEYYADAVRTAALRRNLIHTGGVIAAEGFDEASPLPDVLARAERALLAVTRQADSGREWRTMADLTEAITADLARAQAGEEPPGIITGFADIDTAITRLFPDQLTVVGARPGVGKTSLLLSLMDALGTAGHHTAAFSLEMADKSLGHRAVAMHSGVETRRLRGGGRLTPEELEAVSAALTMLAALPMSINDTPGITLQELASKARRLHAERPIACLFVDYLQLVKDPAGAREKRYLEVSAVARGLKDLSRELHIHIVALSQLTRDAEDRVPTLSDLRESGEIEQAADNVWMLYRKADEPGITELHIVKHREGPLAVVPLRFDARTTRFQTLERYREPEGYGTPAPAKSNGRQNGKGRAMAERLGTRTATAAPAVDDFFRSSEDHDFTPLSEGDDDAAYGD
jgi:replicative DNA helicase